MLELLVTHDQEEHVRVEIMDILGNIVAVLADADMAPGESRLEVPRNLRNGTYIAHSVMGGLSTVAKFCVYQ